MKFRLTPYCAGPPVSGKNFVGREHILEAVQKREKGTLIIGPFRWGKTSILDEGIRRLGSDNVVVGNVAAINNSKDILRGIFRNLNSRMNVPDSYGEAVENLKALDKELHEQGTFKYIFIDEFTSILKDKKAVDALAFFHELRQLKAIKLVIAIHPQGVWKAQELFPSFLESLEHHLVGPLLEQDVDKLIGLSAESGLTFTPEAREAVHKRTGRITIFVQILLSEIVMRVEGNLVKVDDIPHINFDFRSQWTWCFTPHQRDIIRKVLKNPGISTDDIPDAKDLRLVKKLRKALARLTGKHYVEEGRIEPEKLLADLRLLALAGFGILLGEENKYRINGDILEHNIGALMRGEERYGFRELNGFP